MKKIIYSFLCFSLLTSLFLVTTAQKGYAAEKQKQMSGFDPDFQRAVYGRVDPGTLRSVMVYLYPKEVLAVNHKIIENYATDPNTPYQEFLNFQDQSLFWLVGQHIFPQQAVVEVDESKDNFVRHPMFTAVGSHSYKIDKDGTYSGVMFYVNQVLHPWKQF